VEVLEVETAGAALRAVVFNALHDLKITIQFHIHHHINHSAKRTERTW
jgi:hypothetical protein